MLNSHEAALQLLGHVSAFCALRGIPPQYLRIHAFDGCDSGWGSYYDGRAWYTLRSDEALRIFDQVHEFKHADLMRGRSHYAILWFDSPDIGLEVVGLALRWVVLGYLEETAAGIEYRSTFL